MLIGNITLTEYGIKLVDVDMSTTELDVTDALKLLTWLDSHRAALGEMKKKHIIELKRRDREAMRKRQEEEDQL